MGCVANHCMAGEGGGGRWGGGGMDFSAGRREVRVGRVRGGEGEGVQDQEVRMIRLCVKREGIT